MSLNFNSQGILHETITLTYEEFALHFGTNERRMDERRMEQIKNSLPYFRIFRSLGCQIVYVDGSFVSKKKLPEDIDICFDISGIQEEKIKSIFPKFFDFNERGRIRRDQQCHIFTFTRENTEIFDLLSTDRHDRPKGLIILDLNEIANHDQK